MRVSFACAAILAASITATGPARAANYLITVIGQGVASVPPNGNGGIGAIAALSFNPVFAQFVVNSGDATYFNSGPINGAGSSAQWLGSVKAGAISIGPAALVSNSNDFGSIFLIDNIITNPAFPNNRFDQATLTSGARFVSGALVKSYDAFNLPPDVYLQSFALGRTRTGDIVNPPTLVTDTTQRPDFPSYLSAPGGTPVFMSLTFRQGNPTSLQQQAALPGHTISVTNLQFFVETITGVPEPTSWAMLIIGFGLIGATLRRRRAVAA